MASLPQPLQTDESVGAIKEHEVQNLWHSLTDKQQSWLMAYLSNGLNATEAVHEAGYQTSSADSARQMAYQNKTHPKMRPLIAHACQRHMGEDEVLRRVSEIAQATWEDFVSFEDGELVPDLEKAKARGKMHLVKEVQWSAEYNEARGEVVRYVKKIKLKDDQKAHDQLLKVFGAYADEDGATIENMTVNQWNQQLNAHLQGQAEEERWPQVPDNTE